MNTTTRKRLNDIRQQFVDNAQTCGCGKKLLHEHPDENPFMIGDKEVCKECWCQAFGEEIEKHPIVAAHRLLNHTHSITEHKA